jgi:O-antigen/teichoic acid export membrane protein
MSQVKSKIRQASTYTNRSFLNKSAWSFASVAFRLLGSVATNKLFALYFGTAGLSILAHFQNLIAMLMHVPHDGVNRGLIKYLADKELEESQRQRYLATALMFNGGLFVTVFITLTGFDELFFSEFRFYLSSTAFYLLFFLASLLFLFNLFLQSVVLAGQQVRAYALFNMAGVLTMLLLLYAVIGSWKIDYALFAFLFGQSASLAFYSFYVFRKGYVKIHGLLFSGLHFKQLMQFVLMAGSVLAFGKLLDFLVRDEIIELYGLQQTGLWQSVVRVSDLYTMLFIATVGAVYYPQLSARANDPLRLKKYFWEVFRLTAPATALGLLTVYLTKDYVLSTLFSAEFVEAQTLFPYQLLGDWFLLMAYLLVYILSVQTKTTTFVISQAFSAFLYVLILSILLSESGIEVLPQAHAFRGIGYFAFLLIVNRKLLLR